MAEEISCLRITAQEIRIASFEIWKRTETDCCSFVYVVCGEVLCRMNDIIMLLRENHTIAVYPQATLSIEAVSKHSLLYWIHVQGKRIEQYVPQAGIPLQGCIAESGGNDRIRSAFLH